MKGLIMMVFVVFACNVFGQDTALQGKYSRGIFMYEYSLSLQDSGKYIVMENSDLESMTVLGTWTVQDNVITLLPIRGWRERVPEKKRVEIQWQWLKPSSLKVDDNNTLTELSSFTNAEGMKTEIRGKTLKRNFR